ncbi:response regulator [Janthinobacterium sp. GMG2]|uniref:response regulator n=1 Tax=unclassified Janthinobacterium TaxID=2610881 RepID=UPI0025B18A26|nr:MULTISPECIES: response regulator [unclassified Janthinobacterium]MDN2675035.1 response regulator [Janthinobacterium sp. SUN026]MDX8120220.1 response regulator [Janthinobacterium sp. GMG2]
MLKTVLIDSSAVARGLLNTVLTDGGYDVCGQTHTSALGLALLVKHHPHFVCIAREQVEDGTNVVQTIRAQYPKTLIFMVSGGIDATSLQAAHAMGVSGFIVKPFMADTVLKTVRNTVIAMVRKQQALAAAAQGNS